MGPTRNALLEICYQFSLPLARLLLAMGISHREFSEVIKRAYVESASVDFGSRGKYTNTSRVAVMTGLTRKEVRRLKGTLGQPLPFQSVKYGPAQAIIRGWRSDADMLDESGKPRTLAAAEDGPGFAELVKRYGGDLPPGAVATELKRTGVVSESAPGELKLVGEAYPPITIEPNQARRIAQRLAGVLDRARGSLRGRSD